MYFGATDRYEITIYSIISLNEEAFIDLQVEVATPGWVAIAFTFRGNMVGSDIIVGWVSSTGIATIVDAHGGPNGEFIRDGSQDYQLIVGYQYQGGTVLRFTRKLNTCDGDDLVITVSLSNQS